MISITLIFFSKKKKIGQLGQSLSKAAISFFFIEQLYFHSTAIVARGFYSINIFAKSMPYFILR